MLIPNTVTNVGKDPFTWCDALTSVELHCKKVNFTFGYSVSNIIVGDEVEYIIGYAFSNTKWYSNQPDGLVYAGKVAYKYKGTMPSGNGVAIKEETVSISSGAFWGCSGMTFCIIPNSVTSIDENAFGGCTGLTSITLPNSVTSISNGAFSGCSGLTSITIPNSVTSIGNCAFYGCTGLTSITIPNSVTTIGNSAFSGCSGLKKVEIHCKEVGSWFGGNRFIKEVVMGNEVTSIGDNAFNGCEALSSVSIGTSVKTISNSAFSSCSGLKFVTLGCKDVDTWFSGFTGIETVVIGDGVTNLAGSAFKDCSALKEITIGKNVSSIGYSAFANCSKLEKVTSKIETPYWIDNSVFEYSLSGNTILYVPKGKKQAYKNLSAWNQFPNIVELSDSGESDEPDIPDNPTTVDVTDISKLTDAIYVEPTNALVGNEVSLQVNLKNANTATSYGFELMLPEGLSINTANDGSFDDAITMSTRHKGHTLITNKLAGNTYKVAVASISSKALSDNDGLVLTIKARVADNVAVGDYPIKVQSPLIVNTDGTKPPVQDTQSKITIEDYVKGDVDGDGVVDLADAVLVINHYVGKPVATFNDKAADVDGDGVIDLADAVLIINYYVGKIDTLAPVMEFDGPEPQ